MNGVMPGTTAEMARPKKTTADLPENWQELMLEIARDGGSELECRHALGISESLWYRLKDEDAEFSQTVKSCKDACQIWWEQLGRNMAIGAIDKGNATTWIFNMKNRFGWHDKQQIDQTSSDGSMTPKVTRIELVAPSVSSKD